MRKPTQSELARVWNWIKSPLFYLAGGAAILLGFALLYFIFWLIFAA